MLRKSLLVILITQILYGCASAPGTAFEIQSNMGKFETYSHLLKMAEKCFSREATPFLDGRLVRYGQLFNNFKTITVHQYAFDIGVLEPDIIILIANDGKNIKVVSDEITDQTEALVKQRVENIDRVKLWAKGNSECADAG